MTEVWLCRGDVDLDVLTEAERARPPGSARCRALLRLALARRQGGDPRAFRLVREPRGGVSTAGVYVSVSHTDGLCAVALSDTPVGVDVERPVALDTIPVADRRFHPDEAAAVRAGASFWAIWTAKEAYTKALGLGLAYPWRSFDVRRLDTVAPLGLPSLFVGALAGARPDVVLEHR